MIKDRAGREAYRRGVHDALVTVTNHIRGPQLRELLHWQRELEEWSSGDPPAPPPYWAGPYLVR